LAQALFGSSPSSDILTVKDTKESLYR